MSGRVSCKGARPVFLGLNMQTVFPPSDLYNWVSRIYEPGSRLLLTEYAFPANFAALGAGERSTQNIQMTQNADFVMTAIDWEQNDPGNVSRISINIVDTSTGEQFSNGSAPFAAIGFIPSVDGFRRNLPYPKWMSGISSILLDVSSTSAQSPFTISLRGFRIQKLG